MRTKHERRRCRLCKKLFSADPRCRFHQRFCPEAACQSASKVESQRKWRAKAENLWHHRREKIFAKLASQGPNGANLAAAAGRDEKPPDDPVIWGIFAVLCGSKRQVLIEETYRDVLAVGREILRNQAVAAARAAARAAGAARRQ
jgi:hypothetical protein